jgi:uncharacterized membrane protein YfcA
MIDINPVTLSALGLVAGMLGAMLGIGGGIFVVPSLSLLLHVPMQTAIACSMVTIVAGSMTATTTYMRDNVTSIKLGMLLASASIPGAIFGAVIAARISSSILSALFGLILLYSAYAMIKQQIKNRQNVPVDDADDDIMKSAKLSGDWKECCYYDKEKKAILPYNFHNTGIALGVSAFSGILASLLGVGGGLINIPVMNIIMKVPMKAAIATSSFVIMMTASVGAFVFFLNGFVDPVIAVSLIIGAFIGARIGARLMQKTRSTMLELVFSGVVIILAVLMFLKAAGIMR